MAQQVINVGLTPNDGQGDAIRTAYIKCNDNFGELFSRAQTSPPVTLVGLIGDQAGMYAYDETFWYYCYADYDGSSEIWAQVTQIGNVSISGIQSGTSEVQIGDINGNVIFSINGTANVATVRTDGITTSSNVTAANVNSDNFYGNVRTSAQPYITSLGTLTALDLSGIVTSTANVTTTGNVIGGNLVTTAAVVSNSVSSTGNITGGNLIGTTSIFSPGTVSATGNITTSGYFIGTFLGNVTGNFVVPGGNTQIIFNNDGNADASANFTFDRVTNILQVTGNVSTGNLLSTVVSATGNITGGNLNTGAQVVATGNITGGNLRTGAQVVATGNITGGNINSNAQVVATGNITSAANITGGNLITSGIISASGNITGGNVVGGRLSAVSNITGANLTVTTASVTGNITGGNVTLSGAISASGNISGANITGTEITATSVNSSGNVTGANLLTGGLISATGNITGGNLVTSGSVSAGSLLGSTVSATGNITGGNLVTSGIVSAGSVVGSTVSAAGNITGDNLIISGLGSFGTTVTATGNITGGNLITGGTLSVTGNIITTGSNGVANIGSATTYFNTVFAKATSAQYADLAENYIADAKYPPGTVIVIGGDKEVTASTVDQDRSVIGVVSSEPAYIMNSGLESETVVTVALVGRVPCFVQGPITRGALLVSCAGGRARAEENPKIGSVVGKALENFDGDQGIIEIIVGKM